MPKITKKEYVIDGTKFSTLDGAAAEFTRVLSPTMPWHGNLDLLTDLLYDGFETADEGYVLVWRHSAVSRECLGYGETIKWLEERLRTRHPSDVTTMQWLTAARRSQGKTLFDILVEIIRDHEDIELRLE